ncbi:hypothetical protein [Leucobacter sp.]
MILLPDEATDEEDAGLFSGSFSALAAWHAIFQAMESQVYFFSSEEDVEQVATAQEIEIVKAALSDQGISAAWSAPFDPRHQSVVSKPSPDGELRPAAVSPHDPQQSLVSFMNDVREGTGFGTWWTDPTGMDITQTSGAQPGLPATGLLGNEDDNAAERASLLSATGAERPLEIYEIDSPEDWLALLALAPVDVTRTRRRTWGRWEPDTRWEMPDWAALSSSFDGVHLTVNGYLQLSCSPLETPSGARTLIAGWGPDITTWLRRPALTWGTPFEVRRVSDAQWVPASETC